MKSALLLILMSPHLLFAQEIVLKKFNSDRTRFSATFSDPATDVGQIYEMKDEFEQSCSANVVSKKDTLVVLVIDKCPMSKDLKEGDKFSLVAIVPVVPPVAVAVVPDAKEEPPKQVETVPVLFEQARWKFGIGLGYQIVSTDAKFSDVEYNGPSGHVTGTADMEFNKVFAIAVEGRYLPKGGWGFQGGLNYEGERKLESIRMEGGGYTASGIGGSDSARVQFSTLYGSAIYRWKEFYLPFGFNVSMVKFSPASGFTGTYKVSGGLGAQIGAGWHFSEQFSLELYSWLTTVKLNTSSSTANLDYGVGRFESLLLMTKFSF